MNTVLVRPFIAQIRDVRLVHRAEMAGRSVAVTTAL